MQNKTLYKNLNKLSEVVIQVGIIGFGVALCAYAKAQPGNGGRNHADVYRSYGGSHYGITRGQARNPKYDECNRQFLNRRDVRVPAEVYAACINAVEEAEDAAFLYATAAGCEDGYFSGFTWALWTASNDYKNDEMARNQGDQDGVQMVAQLNSSAVQHARNDGRGLGAQEGLTSARKAWGDATDQGLGVPNPNPQPRQDIPYTSSPLANPYANFNAQPLSLEEMAAASRYNASQISLYKFDGSRLCSRNLHQLMREQNSFRMRDYYRKDGIYSFDRNRARNGEDAFKLWESGKINTSSVNGMRRGNRQAQNGGRRSNGSTGVGYYQGIRGKTISVPVGADDQPVRLPDNGGNLPAPSNNGGGRGNNNGNGPRGNGSNGNGGGNNGSGTPTPTAAPTTPTATPVPTPTPIVFNLDEIYRKNFAAAYNLFAGDFYDDGFEDVLNDGSFDGGREGVAIGMAFARQEGAISGFNRKFREKEFYEYNDSYENQYNQTYGTEFSRYKNNAIISVKLLDVVGAVDDGILQPGETVYPVYEVKNYGGVTGNLQLALSGSGLQAAGQVPLQIAPVSIQKKADTNLSGRLANLSSLSDANIRLTATGGEQTTASELSRTVTREVTLEGVDYAAVSAAGVVKVYVGYQNRSPKLPTTDDVKVIVTDHAGRSVTQNFGRIAPNKKEVKEIQLTGFKPMDVFQGRIGFSVQVLVGSNAMAQTRVQAVYASNSYSELALIFDQLAQTSADAAQTKEALDLAVAWLYGEINGSRAGAVDEDGMRSAGDIGKIRNNHYSDEESGQIASTSFLHQVIKAYRSHPQTEAAKKQYRDFANQTKGLSKNLKAALFGTAGKKTMDKWMKELSK